MNHFENYFLKDHKFINSDDISIADVSAVIEFQQLVYLGIDIGKNRPNVKAWRERVIAKLGPSSFDSIHQPLAKMTESMGIKEDFE